MGVRILQGDDKAVLYCSTSEWAFGPLFSGAGDFGPHERAEQFLKWLNKYTPPEHHLNAGKVFGGWRHDPRQLTDQGLETAYYLWLQEPVPSEDEIERTDDAGYEEVDA